MVHDIMDTASPRLYVTSKPKIYLNIFSPSIKAKSHTKFLSILIFPSIETCHPIIGKNLILRLVTLL